MTEILKAIPAIRSSVVAILRVHRMRSETIDKKGKVPPAQFNLSFGSAFCVLQDRYLLTAYHLLTDMDKPRDPKDKFYAFSVPDNGDHAFHFPITAFPIERPDLDLAVLEIGPCVTPGVHLPAIPISFEPCPDGTQVITVGFPSPEVEKLDIDSEGNYLGGMFRLLKSHANDGIVAAQYNVGVNKMYELNVGWHHGESGGPIASATSSPVAFSLMQHYRHIQAPHGIVVGPHRGFALSCIANELKELGISPV